MPSINKSARSRLGLETLEGRLTPATSGVNFWGDLVVTSSEDGENISVSLEARSEGNMYTVRVNGVERFSHHASSVWGGDVFLHGNGGNDTLRNWTGLATWAYGGFGDDILHGSSNHDYLDGGFGADQLFGYGGNDILYAGYDLSSNMLNGGDDNDQLFGGFVRDNLFGEGGNDHLFGFFGDDVLDGGHGNDHLYGEVGTDYLYGWTGNDVLDGGDDGFSDYLDGGTGYDYLQRDWQWIGNSLVNVDGSYSYNWPDWRDSDYG